MEFWADTSPPPHDIPGDTLMVVVFREDLHPPRYEFVCMVTGAANFGEVKDPLGVQFPWLAGRVVLVTKVGGTSSRVRRLRIDQTFSTAVEEETVEAPVPA